MGALSVSVVGIVCQRFLDAHQWLGCLSIGLTYILWACVIAAYHWAGCASFGMLWIGHGRAVVCLHRFHVSI